MHSDNSGRVFKVLIDCENDAFEPSPIPELARILRRIADRIEAQGTSGAFESITYSDVGFIGIEELTAAGVDSLRAEYDALNEEGSSDE